MTRFHNIYAALLARFAGMAFVWLVILTAPAAEPTGGGRWLLVFDTSSTMKKFMPAAEVALKNFLMTSADGQMQAGDSVGVWVVNQQVGGQYPTFSWAPEESSTTLSNLVAFLKYQRYAAPTQLGSMSSSLNYVMANSRRITVVLFTDGRSDMSGTTFDDGVNQMFHDTRDERLQSLQPIVVVMRAQLSKPVGCTINYPPGPVNLPPFPPPPEMPKVVEAPKPVNVPPPQAVQSLVIVGKSVSTNGALMATNSPVVSPAVNPPVVAKPLAIASNPPPIVVTQIVVVTKTVVTNPMVIAPQTSPPPALVVTAASTTVMANTNVAAPARAETKSAAWKWVAIGVGASVVVIVFAIVLVRSRRVSQSSLISSSMQDEQRRR